MQAQAVYVGVDVSKEWLDVALRPSGEVWREANHERAVGQLVERLKSLHCHKIVLEATGGYESLLAAALAAAAMPVVVINPRWARAFAHSIGGLAKTDRLDARMLAQYAERPELAVRALPDGETRALRALVARREQLVEMKVAEEHRLERAPKQLEHKIAAHVEYLSRQIKDLDRDLDQALKSSALWRQQSELLKSVPGVGPVACAAVLARLPELGRLSRREVAKLVGVAPINRDSGKSERHRSIQGGRFALRRTLYMAALSAARCNPVLREFYLRLCTRRPRKVALIATMRKLLVILNAMLRDHTHWRYPACAAAS